MRVYEKNNHWYFEMMVRKKRYCRAISEANNEKEAIAYMIERARMSRAYRDSLASSHEPDEIRE